MPLSVSRNVGSDTSIASMDVGEGVLLTTGQEEEMI